MRRLIVSILLGAFLVLGSAAQARAVELCFNIEPFANVFRLEFPTFGNFAAIHGRERLFTERTVVGTAYLEPGGLARLGFIRIVPGTPPTSTTFDVQLNISTLSGTWTSSTPNSGTIVPVPCSGGATPDTAGLLDELAQ